MLLPRPRTTLRVLPGLLVSAVAFGMLPAPSYAVPAHPSAANRPATGLPKLEDDAIDALRRVTTAKTRYDKAIDVRDQRIERVQMLGDQAAEASERARLLHAQVDGSRTGLLLDPQDLHLLGGDAGEGALDRPREHSLDEEVLLEAELLALVGPIHRAGRIQPMAVLRQD